MKNITFYIRNITKAIFLFIDLLRYKLSGKSPNEKYPLLLNSFYVFGGVMNNIGTKLLKKRKTNFNASKGLLGNLSSHELENANQFLKENGFVVLENVLSADMCEKILNLSLKIPGSNRAMDLGQNATYAGLYNRVNPSSNRFEYDGTTLVNQPEIQEILADESLMAFAQEYLGGSPILDLVSMWWHAPFKQEADQNAAQWFHFDMERVKWIKFFFYITDVDTNSGPHTFIPKTHRTRGIPAALRRKGYVRLSDEEVSDHFSQDSWQEFTGKRGTLIVEDTRGLHKGKHCLSGDRLLFQLEYTVSDYGAAIAIPVLHLDNASNKMLDAVKKFPLTYSMIEIE